MERYEVVLKQGVEAHNKGDLPRAVKIYDAILASHPNDGMTNLAMGTALNQTQMNGLALVCLKKATAAMPDNPEAWHNRAITHRTLGQIDEAVDCYMQELKLPLTSEQASFIYGNLSGCYINEARPDDVIKWADKGLRFKDTPQLRNHKALALLEKGEYEAGFRLYEARIDLPEYSKRDFGKIPAWDGKPVGTLLISGEQGIGDEVLYLSALHKVMPLVERVQIECTPRLKGLLTHTFRDQHDVRIVSSHKEQLATSWAQDADAHVAMGSLFLHTWPHEKNIWMQPSRVYRRGTKRRIGLSWRGGTLKTHEYYRNAPLEDWKPLVDAFRDDDAISLQYGDAAGMAQELGIPHDAGSIADIDTLAGMIQSCDLVISVCNTTIHLAGAMGVPCLVLVPHKAAWRYGLKGDRSHWYENQWYIRQAEGELWASVIQRAKEWALAYLGRVPAAEREAA
jgi:tetratricopeptide (TPR) repeat protein